MHNTIYRVLQQTKPYVLQVVRVDKFDSITLNLPEQKVQNLLSLGQLLGEYVAPENVNDVECEVSFQKDFRRHIITQILLPVLQQNIESHENTHIYKAAAVPGHPHNAHELEQRTSIEASRLCSLS